MDIVLSVLFIAVLVATSAVFSGLNIALMSLNLPELKRLKAGGNKQAKKVYPLRKNTHLSLAAILIGNIGAASATALVMDRNLGNGIAAGALSTVLLVIFGELLPQALFAKNALKYCTWFSPVLRLIIFLSYPLAKPMQLMLDRVIGKHSENHLHTRKELGIIITEHLGQDESELDEDEVEIVRGALQLSEKQVSDIMTDIDHTFWLEYGSVVDGKKIDEIKKANRSRIPVFDRGLAHCFGVVHMKDMVDIDFDEDPKLVQELKLYATKQVGGRTALDTMFRKFISARSHLIPVEKNDRIVGIVTIEDLIEEIIGHEIQDEVDQRMNR